MSATTAPVSITNSKGVVFSIGDLIFVKGSKIPRRIASIHAEWGVCSQRTDGGIAASSSWGSVDRLVHRAA